MGAGKTTLLRLLAGEVNVTSGSAIVVGHDVLTERENASPTKGLCKEFFPKNPRLLWKWLGGSRSQSDFFVFVENRPNFALNQC